MNARLQINSVEAARVALGPMSPATADSIAMHYERIATLIPSNPFHHVERDTAVAQAAYWKQEANRLR